MKIYNSTQNNIISKDAKVADNFFSRSIGLLSKKTLSESESLVIKPCCSIHTFFMRFDIDVLFVGINGKIIALYENVKPWRILPIHLTSKYVVELAAGSIVNKNISKDDIIKVEAGN